MNRLSLILLSLCGCAVAGGTSASAPPSSSSETQAAPPAASAVLAGRSDSTMTGAARFTPAPGNKLAVHLQVEGAPPGQHGVHIHEKGDCSDPKAASAGGHFNPGAGAHHGGPATDVRHSGDLGNMVVDDTGKGTLDVVVSGLSVSGAKDGVIGRSIVVHEKTDDLKSDPAGNSGTRIACGVIRPASAF